MLGGVPHGAYVWGEKVICPVCGRSAESQQRFCGDCGASLNGSAGHSVSTGGGDIQGNIYQAGRDVVVNHSADTAPVATYKAVPKWRSPITQALLSWVGLLVGLMSLFPLWKIVQPAVDLLRSDPRRVSGGDASITWLIVFSVLILVLVVALNLRSVTSSQLRKPLIFGWAVSGSGRRITLEKIVTGKCPQCGGKMRYYNKPVSWIDYIEPNGRQRRKVTERVPALECRRNPKHWGEVDPAESQEV